MAETQITHLQTFQSMVEAVKVVFSDSSSGGGGGGKGITTQAGLSSMMAGLGSGG